MRENLTSFLLICSCIVFMTVSCSKGGDDKPAPAPKDILTSHSWTFSQYKEDGVVKTLKASCEMDDYWAFSTSGTYTRNAGATKCSAGDPQTFTDNWSISADNRTLTILSEVTGELTAITDASFTVKRTGASIFEYTYVKK